MLRFGLWLPAVINRHGDVCPSSSPSLHTSHPSLNGAHRISECNPIKIVSRHFTRTIGLTSAAFCTRTHYFPSPSSLWAVVYVSWRFRSKTRTPQFSKDAFTVSLKVPWIFAQPTTGLGERVVWSFFDKAVFFTRMLRPCQFSLDFLNLN